VTSVRCCVWELTLACNLRCRHCGVTAGQGRAQELSTGEALTLADDLADLPCQEVTLMGGELFLRPDWFRVAERLCAGGVGLVIFSNGWLLDRLLVEQIRELEPRTVGLSLDGARPEVHDALRGVAGSHQRVWQALTLLKSADIPVSVVTTLTRHNVYELPQMAHQLLGRGVHWQLQVASCNGARMTSTDQLTPLEFYWVGAWLNLARQKYAWTALPVAGAHDLGHFSSRLGTLLPPGCQWTGCTAGLDTLGIQSHGGVKGCLSLPDDYVEANVRERTLAEIWHDFEAFALNRRFGPEMLQGYCAECAHGPTCRGGCSDMAHSASGSPYDNPYCFHKLEEVGW
jgi:radical SAM protein with 4Fe4S-binding SPASM domain